MFAYLDSIGRSGEPCRYLIGVGKLRDESNDIPVLPVSVKSPIDASADCWPCTLFASRCSSRLLQGTY